ncbi:DUF4184 family protein [Providencia rustigianii]|uniref:DUF4184 family protein n=1 Tax=Providencia rustigianii TaxID=158850 RepID=UPI00223FB40A|nr:DUF4184 family protein [Providencia rustigianii]
MPWTFSHPAVVFPIKQSKIGQWLSLPALILGSISPDLLYSFGLYQLATDAHSILGWLYIGLPLCLLIHWAVCKLETPLSTVVPFPIKKIQAYSLRYGLVLIISFFIGALTHIFWDALTHETGAAVRYWPFLQLKLHMTDKQEIGIYKILQHLGSLLGLLYLSYQYWRYHKRQPDIQRYENGDKVKKIFIIGIFSSLFAFPIAYHFSPKLPTLNLNRFVYLELTIIVPIFFFILIGYGFFKVYRKNSAPNYN